MPPPFKIDRPKSFEVYLPESVYTRFRAELFSELEGRVPRGKLSSLVEQLIREWLASRGVEL